MIKKENYFLSVNIVMIDGRVINEHVNRDSYESCFAVSAIIKSEVHELEGFLNFNSILVNVKHISTIEFKISSTESSGVIEVENESK